MYFKGTFARLANVSKVVVSKKGSSEKHLSPVRGFCLKNNHSILYNSWYQNKFLIPSNLVKQKDD